MQCGVPLRVANFSASRIGEALCRIRFGTTIDDIPRFADAPRTRTRNSIRPWHGLCCLAVSKPGILRRVGLTRSQVMARIRATHTSPEWTLRQRLWRLGARYRLHVA